MGLIWIQTVFANVNREREGETGACTFFQENQSASAAGQIERERERERVEKCVCVLFKFLSLFLTLRARPRILKFRVDLCKKILTDDGPMLNAGF